MHHANSFVSARKFIQDPSCGILRSVIHGNDFKPGIIDGCKRRDRRGQFLFLITSRKNQRNAWTVSIGRGSKILNKWKMQRAVRHTQPVKNPKERGQSKQRQSQGVLDFFRQNWYQALASVILALHKNNAAFCAIQGAAAVKIPIETTTLANGLKVVVAPDTTAPVVTVGVYYKIGFRLEPQGRSGFAHLFEHMMFQGSAHAPKMQHIKLINSSGGTLNGSTHYDVTNYFESVPSNALERILWLEADRMRALKVDDENLRNQRDVVKEEVRVNVLNQPYGGFPWLDLPPIAYRNWSNAHNFYGDFDDLDAATLEDVQKFFKTYYAPSNAVLLILGDVDTDEGIKLAERHFAGIPSGPQPAPADIDEPPQIEERRGVVEEKFGTLPGVAIGYQAPRRLTPEWYAAAMLDSALHGGRAGRVHRKLVLEQQVAVDAEGGIHYPVGDLFDYNGPTLLVTRLLHKPEYFADQTIAAYDQVLDE